jgi:hypothetical protein
MACFSWTIPLLLKFSRVGLGYSTGGTKEKNFGVSGKQFPSLLLKPFQFSPLVKIFLSFSYRFFKKKSLPKIGASGSSGSGTG